jgi:hypothetical protein
MLGMLVEAVGLTAEQQHTVAGRWRLLVQPTLVEAVVDIMEQRSAMAALELSF